MTKQNEDKITTSEMRYRRLFESAQDGIIILDATSGHVQDANPFLLDLLGYALEDLIGKELWEIGLFQDISESRAAFRQLQNDSYIRYEDLPLKTRDGRHIDVEFISNVYLVNDEKVIQCNIRDITKRKRTEQALSTSEMRYRRLFESAKDGIIILDATSGQVRDANPFLLDLLGYALEDLIGKELWEIGLFQDISESRAAFRQLQDNSYIRYEDLPLKTRDGRHIDVEFVSNVYLANDEKVIQCNIRDITERIRTEGLLEQERRLMRTLIDSIPDRIYTKDTEGRFTLKNESDVRQMGAASTTEVMGKTDFDYYPSELAARYSADDQSVIQSGQALINREEVFLDADGNSGWMLTTKVPLRDKQDRVIGLVGIGRDITDRKQAEEKLTKMNRTLALISGVNKSIVRIRLLSELFETVCRIAVEVGGFHMVWIGLLDSETRRVNSVAHGGVAEDYLEMLDIVLDDDDPRGHGPTASALRTGEPIIVNNIGHDPSMTPWRENALRLGYRASAAFPLNFAGEMRGVLNLYTNQTDFFDAGEVDQLSEMAADITFAMEFAENEAQRKQALIALQQQVQAVEAMRLFLKTTLDAFPANTAVLDPDGIIINVNASWMRFAEENGALSPMHYLGENYLTVCDTAMRQGSKDAASASAGLGAVIDGSQYAFYMEYPCHSPSEKRWFALQVTPFPEPPPRRVVVAHINVTERKQAEEDLQNLYKQLERRVIERTAQLQASKERVEAILSNSAEAILLVNSDFSIQQTNTSFNDMFNCEQDDYFDKSLNALLGDNDAVIMDRILQAAAEQSKLFIDVEARRKDNTVFAAELSIGFIRDNGLVCTFHNINVRKQAEKSLQIAVEKQKELNELKTRFVSMASHEFRTPLATIHAATETLSAYRDKLTEEQIGLKLSNIREQVGYLKDIMDDVLKLAQLQTRGVAFKPEIIDFDLVCREVIDEYQNRKDISHNILYTCEEGLPTAQLDKKLIRQLVSNLVSNAIKYSPHDKTIILNLKYTAEALVFTASDSGIGIPEDDLKHLFEPFHRAANVGTIHGTGLGMVIAKESVELHGGTITVESQVGIGTTFTIHIPIKNQRE